MVEALKDNDNYDFDLLCIGSGPGSQRAAIAAAKAHKRVAIVERWPMVGGVCTHTGTIPSKTFRHAVGGMARWRQVIEDGYIASERSMPGMAQLIERVDSVIREDASVIEHQLRRNNVQLVEGFGSFVDPHTVSVSSETGGRTLTAKNILIGVGTRPAKPPSFEGCEEFIKTSDALLRINQLPKSLIVVGAGVIGIEYASMFAQLEVDVTLIDRRERPLEFVDHELVDELLHQLRAEGVTCLLGEDVDTIERYEGECHRGRVKLKSGKQVVGDVILFSIGRQGQTEGLNLEAAGLEADCRGRLTVDEQFRTEVNHIFAVGDVIGYPALAATSSEQGRHAANAAFGLRDRPMPSHFPIGIYSIPAISMVGRTEQELTAESIPYVTGVARYEEIARGQIVKDCTGLFKMLFHSDTHALLGVHCIGTEATELVHIGQAVLHLGGGMNYFLDTVFNYPTFAECYKVAAFDAANKLGL